MPAAAPAQPAMLALPLAVAEARARDSVFHALPRFASVAAAPAPVGELLHTPQMPNEQAC